MSVIMHKEEGSSCPRCGHDTMVRLALEDKEFGVRNSLSATEILDISEEGEFIVDACTSCGFKLIENDGTASTSQIKSALYSVLIPLIIDAKNTELEEMVDELSAVGAIKKSKEREFIIIDRSSNDDVRLELIRTIIEYVGGCDVDTLVDMYNSNFADEIVEAARSNNNRSFKEILYTAKRLASSDVLADD